MVLAQGPVRYIFTIEVLPRIEPEIRLELRNGPGFEFHVENDVCVAISTRITAGSNVASVGYD